MSRNTKYEPYQPGRIQDFRLTSDYKPTINRSLIPGRQPGRKRQFSRVHHDLPPNNTNSSIPSGSSGSSQSSFTDENRKRKFYRDQKPPIMLHLAPAFNPGAPESRRSVKLEFPKPTTPHVPVGYKGISLH